MQPPDGCSKVPAGHGDPAIQLCWPCGHLAIGQLLLLLVPGHHLVGDDQDMGEKNAVQVNSLSCASAGYCAAGGRYRDGSGHFQAFVVTEQNGAWGPAIQVPGSACSTRGGLPASPPWLP